MRRALLHAAIACVPCAALAVAVACGGNGPVTYAEPFDASGYVDHFAVGAGVGQSCASANDCRAGLSCNASTCAPSHADPTGTPCTISAECATGDYCGPTRTCAPAGKGGGGATCGSDADCASGLRCNLDGLGAECQPEGSTDVGGACKSSSDCFGGLACANGACTSLPPSTGAPPIALPTWPGETCTDDPGPGVEAYFRVPRGSNDGDFFLLPFPNDVRLVNGHPSLAGFPTPGTALLGFDLVDRYRADLQANADGWSTYPTVTLRFSGPVDLGSLKKDGALAWLEVNDDGTTSEVGFDWTATTGRNQYVCANSVSARPQRGLPLDPGRTFLFVVTSLVVAADESAIKVSADLTGLLGSATPADPAVASSYATYAPLRAWAAANNASVISAAVFTTGHVTAIAPKIAATVTSAAAPTAANWVNCASAPSPCPQADGDRACGAPDPNFDELHALVTLPILQAGTEPYVTPDQGGAIGVDGTGNPSVQRTEQVCMALTIPKTAPMPAGGWPLVVYAHGTDGSFRSHVGLGVASSLAEAKNSSGVAAPMAVLGIDQVDHGTRRGGSTDTPDHLFYNFANPAAARGNPLQGAADQVALLRYARAAAIDGSLVGGDAGSIKFGSIAFWGHSQGATAVSIAMPYVTGVSGVVLSGQGASLIDALLTKKNPIDIADVVPAVIEDPAVDVYHPVLSLLQTAIDPADPLNHAIAIAASPVNDAGAKSVFQPYGLGDTYAPPVTEATYAIAARFGVAAAPSSVSSPDSIGGQTPVPVPASGNFGAASAFVREYQPTGYDGHFVAYQDPTASADVATFLADCVSPKPAGDAGAGAPKIGR